ncbi:MAG: HD domain-containing protein [Candidatus Limnocylindrales bacterium]
MAPEPGHERAAARSPKVVSPAPRPKVASGRLPTVPAHVTAILERLRLEGHAAYVVGGSLRDALLERHPADWDVATDARPERVQALFPGSHYENRFGTVLVPGAPQPVEVTTFRRDHAYADHRRPDQVTFSASLEEDLARRDFTVNAIALGPAGLLDPQGGLPDLDARLIRAVGDPHARFDEDALRLLRAVRLATQLEFEIEPGTLAAMRANAEAVRHVSRERIGQELRKLLRAPHPDRGLRLLAETGLLETALPVLAAQRGLAQDKTPGEDLWDHTVRTVAAAAELAPGDETLLLAALLHDIGKPETLADGHFYGHDEHGARRAEELLRDLAVPRREALPVEGLVRWHMFQYEPEWSDAAVRRFIGRVGPELLPRLLLLRAADNVGSGGRADAAGLGELQARIARQQAAGVALTLADLAIDGDDLQAELGLPPGPHLGQLLNRLLESVLADPSRNSRATLLADARAWSAPDADPAP